MQLYTTLHFLPCMILIYNLLSLTLSCSSSSLSSVFFTTDSFAECFAACSPRHGFLNPHSLTLQSDCSFVDYHVHLCTPLSIYSLFFWSFVYVMIWLTLPSCKISMIIAGSLYQVPISSAILQLQENGRLHVLKKRWWKQRRGGGMCDVSVILYTGYNTDCDVW